MKSFNIHVLLCAIASCLAPISWAASLAANDESIDYFCPSYEGTLQFNKVDVAKRFGVQFPTKERPPDTHVANVLSPLINCAATADMLCLQERPKGGNVDNPTYVYAVPKNVTGNTSYSAAGWTFSTFYEKHTTNVRPSIVVVAVQSDKKLVNSGYKMYLEDGLGVKYIYFEKIKASLYATQELNIDYPDITCILQSKYGLFSSAKVQ